jgi:hypothetical protein
MSQPSAPRTIHDDFETIRYERVLVAMLPTLEEPRVVDPDLALKRLRFLTETLAGFAVGAAVGAPGRAARSSFGEEVRRRVSFLLVRIVRDGSAAAAVSELEAPARFQHGPDRPQACHGTRACTDLASGDLRPGGCIVTTRMQDRHLGSYHVAA